LAYALINSTADVRSFEGLRAQRGILEQERRDVSADDRCSDGDCVELLAGVLGDGKPDPAAIATMKTGM
jgi:hypothetical protein